MGARIGQFQNDTTLAVSHNYKVLWSAEFKSGYRVPDSGTLYDDNHRKVFKGKTYDSGVDF